MTWEQFNGMITRWNQDCQHGAKESGQELPQPLGPTVVHIGSLGTHQPSSEHRRLSCGEGKEHKILGSTADRQSGLEQQHYCHHKKKGPAASLPLPSAKESWPSHHGPHHVLQWHHREPSHLLSHLLVREQHSRGEKTAAQDRENSGEDCWYNAAIPGRHVPATLFEESHWHPRGHNSPLCRPAEDTGVSAPRWRTHFPHVNRLLNGNLLRR